MKEFFLFISGVFAGKLIEDNLPNLHYKNIITGFQKYIAPVLLIAYLGYLSLLIKITRSPEMEKEYFKLLILMVTTTLLHKAAEKKKQSA